VKRSTSGVWNIYIGLGKGSAPWCPSSRCWVAIRPWELAKFAEMQRRK